MRGDSRDAAAFRRFIRFVTRLAGALDRRILGGPLSLAEARILWEIGHRQGLMAADLSRILGLDRGYLSRMLKSMAARELVASTPSPDDRRRVILGLTGAGAELLAGLEERSGARARRQLADLAPEARERAVEAMHTLEEAFAGHGAAGVSRDVRVRPRESGDVGWVLQRHGELYRAEYGFDVSFEGYVLDGLACFHATSGERSRLFVAVDDAGGRLGAVAVVDAGADAAQLRWFLVEPFARGCGVGGRLLAEAIRFAREQGYGRMLLWTLSILPQARRLYERAGFRLAESKPGRMGGRDIVEERWELELGS